MQAMRKIWDDPETEGILLIDASNAFNAMNRKVALKNLDFTCPELAVYLRNVYNGNAELFFVNSNESIMSKEGATQGGSLSMAFYAVSTMSLLDKTPSNTEASKFLELVKKVGFADDGAHGCSSLESLLAAWIDINKTGPPLGYFPNAEKTWLIVKPHCLEKAKMLFKDFPDIKITCDGHEYLGSFIGTKDATQTFMNKKVKEWSEDIEELAKIAEFDPQLACCAYIFAASKRWQFVMRTTPFVSEWMKPLEILIREKLIPALIGPQIISEDMRSVFALPARVGGLGLSVPHEECEIEYANSKTMTQQLSNAIFEQDRTFVVDEVLRSKAAKEVRERKAVKIKREMELPLRHSH